MVNSEEAVGLECGLCHENYSNDPGRVPRVLHGCGHSVCERCCGSLFETRSSGVQLICPFDRIPSSLMSCSVVSLKKNYALIELIERVQKKQCQSTSSGTSSYVDHHVKDALLGISCDENRSHIAIIYCTVCESHLCAECSVKTHASRVLSKHTRVPLSEKPVSRPMCPYHSAYAIEFICQEIECLSESRLMCLLCRDYGRHKRHRHSLLEVEASELRKRVKESLSDFRRFTSDLNSWNSRVAESVTELTDNAEGSHITAKRQIEAHFRRLHEELDTQEQTAITSLDAHVVERLDALRAHQQELALITSQVSAISAQLQKSARLDDAKLMEQQTDLIHMLDAVRTHQYDIASAPCGVSLDTRIPFSFTADNVIHMGSNVDVRLVVLGLDGAGKTTILFKLKNDEVRSTVSTIGFNVETLQYKNFKLTIWDVGGLPKLRPLWKHYYLNTQALVFVIDGSCPRRFAEAQTELVRILAERELTDASFLVVINRRRSPPDQPTEYNSAAIDQLVININRYSNGRKLLIHHCDAMSGIGIWEALDSLTSNISLIQSQTEILEGESFVPLRD